MSERIIKWGIHRLRRSDQIQKADRHSRKIENSEVVAVMSRNGDKAKTYAKERGIPKWYDDAQELIDDEEVNAVYIATPPSSHATYAIMSMKAGKPVYIEKPMAVTYEECCRINRISKETGCSMFCCVLPPLSALLPKGKVTGRGGIYWQHHQHQSDSPSLPATSTITRKPTVARATGYCRWRILL